MSRIISSAIISESSEAPTHDEEGNEVDITALPCRGRHFMSFVDSRSQAARATLNQTKDQEKLWVYSRVFNELNKMANAAGRIEAERHDLEERISIAAANRKFKEVTSLANQLDNLNAGGNYLTWNQIYELLKGSPEANWLSAQNINDDDRRSDNDQTIDEDVLISNMCIAL